MDRNVIISLIVLLAGMLACAVPPGMTPTPVTITQVVVVPNEQESQVQASPTLPLPTVPPVTETLASTATLSSTSTLVGTSTNSPTATLSGPVATFIKDANCRSGPGTSDSVVTSFFNGETVQIVGRNPDYNNTWWYVVIPSTGGKCWVSLTTAQAYGNFDAIPTVKP
jgi:hypothetical protein